MVIGAQMLSELASDEMLAFRRVKKSHRIGLQRHPEFLRTKRTYDENLLPQSGMRRAGHRDEACLNASDQNFLSSSAKSETDRP